MIPTLFGVTIVSFVIMQLAPGDPLLAQADAGGSASRSAQTRDAYLLQKRDLQLDKPLVLNFNDFRDFTAPVDAAAHFLALTPQQVTAELAQLADDPVDPVAKARLAFLESLPIKDFNKRLEKPSSARPWPPPCWPMSGSIAKTSAVTACRRRSGCSSRTPRYRTRSGRFARWSTWSPSLIATRSPARLWPAKLRWSKATWRSWWQKARSQVSAGRRRSRQSRSKADWNNWPNETDRQTLFNELDTFDREDTPFFVGVLLGQRDAAGAEGNRGHVPVALQQQAAGDRRAAGCFAGASGRRQP